MRVALRRVPSPAPPGAPWARVGGVVCGFSTMGMPTASRAPVVTWLTTGESHPGRLTAVHGQAHPGDERGVVAGENMAGPGDV